jgi:hypothetical protein
MFIIQESVRATCDILSCVLTWLDWIIVAAPVLLGVLGVWLSLQPPKRKAIWMAILILLGVAATAATLYQIRQTRAEDQAARVKDGEDKSKLLSTIEGLKKAVGLLGNDKPAKPQRVPLPDLRLRFVSPQEVAIMIDNAKGGGIADRPKYGVALVDLDNPTEFLRIPTAMGDYIRPGESWGPNQFMGIDAAKAIVKKGDRVFGSVSVSCPTCMKSRGYWLFIKVGEGGWYVEQAGEPKGLANLKAAIQMAADFDTYANTLAPPTKRITIK